MSPDRITERPAAMIRTIQARNYRCLRHVDVRLDEPFQVLVGPNGSGKSTLFDAIQFIFDLIHDGLESAVARRTRNFQDLVWDRPKEVLRFELAIEVDLKIGVSFRYEIAIEENSNGLGLVEERGYFGRLPNRAFDALFNSDTALTKSRSSNLTPIFRRQKPRKNENRYSTDFFLEDPMGPEEISVYHSEVPSIGFVTLVNQVRLHEDDDSNEAKVGKFNMPKAADAVRELKQATVRPLQLDSRWLRKAVPLNGEGHSHLAPDGRNLPWIIDSFRQKHPNDFENWLRHLRTALRDIVDIHTIQRDDDRHAYLMVRYANDVEVPSWGVSEGTLRLIVLTLLAYLPKEHPVAYLLEEPENGIHPMAIETAYKSLSSVYDAQVFVASHSPTFLRCVTPKEVLCFSRGTDGAAVITPGSKHPGLADWKGSVDNDLLFANEILG